MHKSHIQLLIVFMFVLLSSAYSPSHFLPLDQLNSPAHDNTDKPRVDTLYLGEQSDRILPEFSLSSSPLPQLNIIQKQIPITETRKELTREYTKRHYGIEALHMDTPKIVVVHWTGGGSINSVYTYFSHDTTRRSAMPPHKGDRVNVGAQFLVDRDGTIYQLFDETFIARHCIGMNYHAIGIENIGGENNQENLTEHQLKSNVQLIYYLKQKYPTIKLVIGHFESERFADYPEFYTELIHSPYTGRLDPGKEFICSVRTELAKLEGQHNPQITKGKN